MNKINNIITCLLLTFFVSSAMATDGGTEEASTEPKAQLRGPAEFQQVVDDYKTYVATIPPEIREEVITFRKAVAQLNKEKSLLHKKLSQASQNYLKKEQQYKKRLPLKRKNLITIEEATPQQPEPKK